MDNYVACISKRYVYYLALYILQMVCRAAIVFLDIFLIDITNSCDPSALRANCFLNTGFNIYAFYDKSIGCTT